VVLALGGTLVAGLQDQQALPGLLRAGDYRPDTAARSRSTSEAGLPSAGAANAGPVYDVGPFPLLPPNLPPGEGREETSAWCGGCHSLRYITMQPALPAEAWQATVRKMIEVHGAAIPEDAAGRIVRYLQERMRPDRPAPLPARGDSGHR
jgi:mono/diheme cytochrome c family protein